MIFVEILFKTIKKHRLVKIIDMPFVFKKRKDGRSKRNLSFSSRVFTPSHFKVSYK